MLVPTWSFLDLDARQAMAPGAYLRCELCRLVGTYLEPVENVPKRIIIDTGCVWDGTPIFACEACAADLSRLTDDQKTFDLGIIGLDTIDKKE